MKKKWEVGSTKSEVKAEKAKNTACEAVREPGAEAPGNVWRQGACAALMKNELTTKGAPWTR